MLDLIATRLRHLNDRPIDRLKDPAPPIPDPAGALAKIGELADEIPPSRQRRPQA